MGIPKIHKENWVQIPIPKPNLTDPESHAYNTGQNPSPCTNQSATCVQLEITWSPEQLYAIDTALPGDAKAQVGLLLWCVVANPPKHNLHLERKVWDWKCNVRTKVDLEDRRVDRSMYRQYRQYTQKLRMGILKTPTVCLEQQCGNYNAFRR